MKKIILVNGIPASGKSRIAQMLAERLNAPVLSIDGIKEPFMLQFADIIDRPLNRKLGYAAYEAMFNIVRMAPEETLFIMDAWFGFREKEILKHYLAVSGCQHTVEIWNQISPQLVAQRYKSRCACRVKGHPGEDYIPELMDLAGKARPMQLGHTFIADQDKGINDSEIISWIECFLSRV